MNFSTDYLRWQDVVGVVLIVVVLVGSIISGLFFQSRLRWEISLNWWRGLIEQWKGFGSPFHEKKEKVSKRYQFRLL